MRLVVPKLLDRIDDFLKKKKENPKKNILRKCPEIKDIEKEQCSKCRSRTLLVIILLAERQKISTNKKSQKLFCRENEISSKRTTTALRKERKKSCIFFFLMMRYYTATKSPSRMPTW